MNFNPEPTLKYSVSKFFVNVWIKIEHYEHPLYWVKGKSSLYVYLFNNKVHNRLILYLEGHYQVVPLELRKISAIALLDIY